MYIYPHILYRFIFQIKVILTFLFRWFWFPKTWCLWMCYLTRNCTIYIYLTIPYSSEVFNWNHWHWRPRNYEISWIYDVYECIRQMYTILLWVWPYTEASMVKTNICHHTLARVAVSFYHYGCKNIPHTGWIRTHWEVASIIYHWSWE